MPGLRNTTPMMDGMFTTLKVRDPLASYVDPGWSRAPAGTVAWKVS